MATANYLRRHIARLSKVEYQKRRYAVPTLMHLHHIAVDALSHNACPTDPERIAMFTADFNQLLRQEQGLEVQADGIERVARPSAAWQQEQKTRKAQKRQARPTPRMMFANHPPLHRRGEYLGHTITLDLKVLHTNLVCSGCANLCPGCEKRRGPHYNWKSRCDGAEMPHQTGSWIAGSLDGGYFLALLDAYFYIEQTFHQGEGAYSRIAKARPTEIETAIAKECLPPTIAPYASHWRLNRNTGRWPIFSPQEGEQTTSHLS